MLAACGITEVLGQTLISLVASSSTPSGETSDSVQPAPPPWDEKGCFSGVLKRQAEDFEVVEVAPSGQWTHPPSSSCSSSFSTTIPISTGGPSSVASDTTHGGVEAPAACGLASSLFSSSASCSSAGETGVWFDFIKAAQEREGIEKTGYLAEDIHEEGGEETTIMADSKTTMEEEKAPTEIGGPSSSSCTTSPRPAGRMESRIEWVSSTAHPAYQSVMERAVQGVESFFGGTSMAFLERFKTGACFLDATPVSVDGGRPPHARWHITSEALLQDLIGLSSCDRPLPLPSSGSFTTRVPACQTSSVDGTLSGLPTGTTDTTSPSASAVLLQERESEEGNGNDTQRRSSFLLLSSFSSGGSLYIPMMGDACGAASEGPAVMRSPQERERKDTRLPATTTTETAVHLLSQESHSSPQEESEMQAPEMGLSRHSIPSSPPPPATISSGTERPLSLVWTKAMRRQIHGVLRLRFPFLKTFIEKVALPPPSTTSTTSFSASRGKTTENEEKEEGHQIGNSKEEEANYHPRTSMLVCAVDPCFLLFFLLLDEEAAIAIKECSAKIAFPDVMEWTSPSLTQEKPSSAFSSFGASHHTSTDLCAGQGRSPLWIGHWRPETELWSLLPSAPLTPSAHTKSEEEEASEQEWSAPGDGVEGRAIEKKDSSPSLSTTSSCPVLSSSHGTLWTSQSAILKALRRGFHEVLRKRLSFLRCRVSYGKVLLTVVPKYSAPSSPPGRRGVADRTPSPTTSDTKRESTEMLNFHTIEDRCVTTPSTRRHKAETDAHTVVSIPAARREPLHHQPQEEVGEVLEAKASTACHSLLSGISTSASFMETSEAAPLATPTTRMTTMRRSRPDEHEKFFIHAIVMKRNVETTEMKSLLSAYVGCTPQCIGIAGMKDKRATTCQRVSFPWPPTTTAHPPLRRTIMHCTSQERRSSLWCPLPLPIVLDARMDNEPESERRTKKEIAATPCMASSSTLPSLSFSSMTPDTASTAHLTPETQEKATQREWATGSWVAVVALSYPPHRLTKPVQLGQLKGNAFSLVVRDVQEVSLSAPLPSLSINNALDAASEVSIKGPAIQRIETEEKRKEKEETIIRETEEKSNEREESDTNDMDAHEGIEQGRSTLLTLRRRLELASTYGFINYFGQQRFSLSVTDIQDHTGLYLFNRDYVSAVRSIFRAAPSFLAQFPSRMDPRFAPSNSNDMYRMTHALKQTYRTYFSTSALCWEEDMKRREKGEEEGGGGYAVWERLCHIAVEKHISFALRSMWVNAAQSLVFNRCASLLTRKITTDLQDGRWTGHHFVWKHYEEEKAADSRSAEEGTEEYVAAKLAVPIALQHKEEAENPNSEESSGAMASAVHIPFRKEEKDGGPIPTRRSAFYTDTTAEKHEKEDHPQRNEAVLLYWLGRLRIPFSRRGGGYGGGETSTPSSLRSTSPFAMSLSTSASTESTARRSGTEEAQEGGGDGDFLRWSHEALFPVPEAEGEIKGAVNEVELDPSLWRGSQNGMERREEEGRVSECVVGIPPPSSLHALCRSYIGMAMLDCLENALEEVGYTGGRPHASDASIREKGRATRWARPFVPVSYFLVSSHSHPRLYAYYQEKEIAGVPVSNADRAFLARPTYSRVEWATQKEEETPGKDSSSGVNVRFSFFLPASSYATVLLREVFLRDEMW